MQDLAPENALPSDPKARWQRLSPLLDELLDMEPPARAARLAAMQDLAPELAAELERLLAQDAALEAQGFLAQPALPPTLSAVVALPGQTVGAYRLERELGQGGMGSVWLARRTDGRFEGLVAIKFLTSGLLGQGDAARFAREGQILARLTHPHIARLIDAGVAQDGLQPYLVLEYVEEGLPIDRFCESRQLDTAQRITLFLDVLAAVAHAHNRLILHRDLKPGNILVDRQGQVKLLDFGIAKLLGDPTQALGGAEATELTRQAGRAFTPQFAAPEQVQGGEVSTATDVYALGVLLYLLLSGGKHPTAGATRAEAQALDRLRAVVEEEPKRLSDQLRSQGDARRARELRGDLDTICAKALKKRPSERYENAAALAEDLRRWLQHEPIAARPDSRSYRLAKFLRRHYLGVAAGSVAALGLSTGIGLALWKAHEAQTQRTQAEGLIEFMLGDLRKKLEPVGRLDVLDAVGEQALGYYNAQDLARSDADSLGRRARALHLMGEIAEKRGKMSEAEQLFRQAADSTGELLARDPRNTQRLFDHAQSSYWVGYAAWQLGRIEIARLNFERYRDLALELTRMDPAKPEWRVETAHAEQNLGVLLLRDHAPRQAIQHFERARATWQELQSWHDAMRAELANTLGWLASAQEVLGQFDASIASHHTKLQLLSGNAGTRDLPAQDLEATTRLSLSRLNLSAGRHEAALAAATAARDAFVDLASVDPDNLDLVAKLCLARLQLIEVVAADREELVGAELSAVAPAMMRLLAANAAKPAWRIKLQGRWLIAQLRQAQDRDARSRLRTSLADLLARAGQEDQLPDNESRLTLATAALQLGDAWLAENRSKAESYWQTAWQYLTPLGKDYPDPRVISLRSSAFWRLGRAQEARAQAEVLARSSYRHPDWQRDLAKMLAEPTQP